MAAKDTSSHRWREPTPRLTLVGRDPIRSRSTRPRGPRLELPNDLFIGRESAESSSEVAPRPGIGVVARKSVESVLTAQEFELFLTRERDLADRGTRVFCLLLLRERSGQGLRQLALKLRERLRSTDLVGRLDRDQVGVLLSDTQPAGARVVGAWVDQCADRLGVSLNATIYVYPSVPTFDRDGDRHDGNGSNGNGSSTDHTRQRQFPAEKDAGVAPRVDRGVGEPSSSASNGHNFQDRKSVV